MTMFKFAKYHAILIYSALILLTIFHVPTAKASGVDFEDNFKGVFVTMANGDSILYPDPKKWAFTFMPGIDWPESYGDGINWLAGNGECQTYLTPYNGLAGKTPVPAALRYDPFSIGTDGLHIKASVLSPEQQAAYKIGQYRRFGSGILLSRASFTYGKIRIIAKMPSALGSWPALWLLPDSREWPPEIDIMEGMAWGQHANQLHSGLRVPKGQSGDYGEWFDIGADIADGFHEYGLDWTADTIAMTFDGKTLWQKPTPASMHQGMYLLINFAVGGQWVFNELNIPPIDGNTQDRLIKGADMIEGNYPSEMVVKSVHITSP